MGKRVLQLAGVILVSLGVLTIISLSCYHYCTKPSGYVSERPVIVERTTDAYVVDLFEQKGISVSRFLTKLCLKFFYFSNKEVKFGEYDLPNNVSITDALEIITSGKVVIHKICIPEGFSVVQVLNRLKKNEFLLGEVEVTPLEGSLLPDTYTFKYPTTRQEIIDMAKCAMEAFVKVAWANRPQDCTLKSPEELINLASIVEKERAKTDAAIISGVYLNRLKIGMRLQADPTTIYAITHGKKLGRPLRLSDLKLKLPHNTYVIQGLPETPICNPGREAIDSVLHPQKHDYLFFAHDRNGKIYLAKTYEQHKANAKKTRVTFKKEDFKKDTF